MKRARLGVKIVFLTVIFISILLRCRALAGPQEWEEIKKVGQSEKAPRPVEVVVRPPVEYNAEGLRDPFERYNKEEVSSPGSAGGAIERQFPTLTVQGLIWGGKFPQAIINDQVVKVGDAIEGASVVSIDKTGVALLFEGIMHTLPPPARAGSSN